MRQLSLLILLATSALLGACQPKNAVPPQAQPVLTLLQAAKSGDRELLKTVFSERMRTRFDDERWDQVVRKYQRTYKARFSDYKLEELAFEFTGGQQRGKVSVVHKERIIFGVRVVKEKADWKINDW